MVFKERANQILCRPPGGLIDGFILEDQFTGTATMLFNAAWKARNAALFFK
jgi:hypothetical protein